MTNHNSKNPEARSSQSGSSSHKSHGSRGQAQNTRNSSHGQGSTHPPSKSHGSSQGQVRNPSVSTSKGSHGQAQHHHQPQQTQGMVMMQPMMIQPVMAIPAHLFTPIYHPIKGVPLGLEALHMAPGIAVQQELNDVELFVDFEMNNRYSVLNHFGQRIYVLAERTDCCTRQMCKQNRPFKVILYDSKGKEILYIERGCGCVKCFFGGEVGGSTVTIRTAHGGILLGTVVQNCNCYRPSYHIDSPEGKTVAIIEGASCTAFCTCCVSAEFSVEDPEGEDLGMIENHFRLSDLFTDSQDTFGMHFTAAMDVRLKASLLGAVICIDYNFFERGQSFFNDKGMAFTGLNCLILWGCIAFIVIIVVFVSPRSQKN